MNRILSLSLVIFFLLFLFDHILAQDLEVAGEIKVGTMSEDNSADSVVVRLSDGRLGVRNTSTLGRLQILSISNDTIFLTDGGYVKLPTDNNAGWIMISDTTSTINYVGIGTNSPDERVHIIGNQKIEGRIEILNALGDSSVFIGVNAGINDVGENNNTAIGASALYSNTTGIYNSASGSNTLFYNTIGSQNTANGLKALYSNTTGNNNTASGLVALYSNTTGNSNTASGVSALYSNTEGNNNTASGLVALYANIRGKENTASGVAALYSNHRG